jgi:hypothetical protein
MSTLYKVSGGVSTGIETSFDETRGQVGGQWRAHLWYRDASRDIVQIATERQLSAQSPLTGNLAAAGAPFTLGAVRTNLGIPNAEIVFAAAWLGAQVEGVFGDGASFKPADNLPNLMDHVAAPLFADTAGAHEVRALI